MRNGLMSIHVMNVVWRRSKHKGSTLLVLLAMADYASDDGTGIWPSYQTLAQKARLSRRQAINVVRSLIESGAITCIGQSATRTNRYQINLAMIGNEKTEGDEGAPASEPDGENIAPKGRAEDTTPASENFSPSQPDGENIAPREEADGEAGFTNVGETGFTMMVKPASPKPSDNHQITTRGDAPASPRAQSTSALRQSALATAEKTDGLNQVNSIDDGNISHDSQSGRPQDQIPAKPDPDPPSNTRVAARPPARNGALDDRDRSKKAILRARCSEGARALMQAFYDLTHIAYTKAWPSAAETMAEAGVTASDLRAALDEARRNRWTVNDPHSLTRTAIRIASQRARRAVAPDAVLEYDEDTGTFRMLSPRRRGTGSADA
ncbi:MAG: helix-turn-helix domain-containing protein [Aggregatilineales bacterium]